MPSPKNISSSQPFVNALNVAYGLGVLTFDLSQTANIIGNGQVAPQRVSVTLNSSGVCPSTPIWFNDQLSPSGTTYLMQLFDKSGNFAATFGQIILSGASVDLSTLVPTSTSGGTVSFAAPVLLNPSSTQTITGQPLILTSSAPLTVAQLNNIVWVDGVSFTTLAAAYAALPSTGGIVMVPPNYTETLAASLTMNKNNAGFWFWGPATISMGSFQVIISPSTNGAFIRSPVVSVLIAGISPVFTYNGNAEAFKVGTSASNTQGIVFEHFAINLTQGGTPAGAAAIGLRLNSTIVSEFNGISVYCQANGHIGLLLDGTGNFTGNNHFKNMNIGLTGGLTATCIKLSNASTINEFENTNLVSAGGLGTGIDMTTGVVQSNQFNVINTEAFATAMSFGASAVQNRATSAFFEANTVDIAWGTSANNRIQVAQASPGNIGAGAIQTDGGSVGNVCEVAGGTLLNYQGPTGAFTGNSADQVFYTYTMPQNMMGPGKGLRIRVDLSLQSPTDTPAIKINFGGTAIGSVTAGGANQTPMLMCEIFNNSGVQNAQNTVQSQNFSGATALYTTFGGITSAINTAAAVIITATFNEATPKQVTGKRFSVELIQ